MSVRWSPGFAVLVAGVIGASACGGAGAGGAGTDSGSVRDARETLDAKVLPRLRQQHPDVRAKQFH